MKKMGVVLIGLMIIAVLSACGTKDNKNTDEVATVTTEVVEDTKSVETTKETTKETTEGYKTEVEKIEKKDLVDVVVGGDVITVNDITTKYREFHLAMLPEIHILVPSDDIVCTVEEGDTMFFKQYEIAIPSEDQPVYCRVNLDNGSSDCHCVVRHEEAVEYGRYIIDYNWCNIAIIDTQTDTSVIVMFLSNGGKSKVTSDYIAALTDVNIEYVKQQMAEWDQDFVPDVEENIIGDAEVSGASDNDGLLECDIIPCGFYDLDGNKYVIVSTYDDDDSGECMLMFGRYDGADSPFDYYDLENVAKNTYSATNWDKVSVTVTFSDGSMDLSGGTGELEEYNGHYTLQ